MEWHILLTVFFSGIMALGVICTAVWFTVQQAINPIKTEIVYLKQEIEESKKNRDKDESNLTKKLDAILAEMKEFRKETREKYVPKAECELTKEGCHTCMNEIKEKIKGL
jgi:hypothetical protein